MATPMINVPDENKVNNLVVELGNRDEVGSIRVLTPDQQARINMISSQLDLDRLPIASESALAEAWLDPEDDHWDDFAKQCIKKGI